MKKIIIEPQKTILLFRDGKKLEMPTQLSMEERLLKLESRDTLDIYLEMGIENMTSFQKEHAEKLLRERAQEILNHNINFVEEMACYYCEFKDLIDPDSALPTLLALYTSPFDEVKFEDIPDLIEEEEFFLCNYRECIE